MPQRPQVKPAQAERVHQTDVPDWKDAFTDAHRTCFTKVRKKKNDSKCLKSDFRQSITTVEPVSAPICLKSGRYVRFSDTLDFHNV